MEAVDKMKTIIFGAGYLGHRIADTLGYQLSDLDVRYPDRLQNFLDRENPDVVINAIGKNGKPTTDWCDKNKEETMQGNLITAVSLATECSKRGIYFVHLGTGCLYLGDNGGKGYSEEDAPNCFGPYYTRTKILAENALKEFPGLLLRLRLPIDNRPHERNLIDKLKKCPAAVDIPNSMTTVPHLIRALEQLIAKRAEGIFNIANPGITSAYEVMSMYKQIVDPDYKLNLAPETLKEDILRRRSNCVLNTYKLKNLGIELPEIHDAVRQCLSNYKDCITRGVAKFKI